MRTIPADFERRIDLPGVGPCPRPVDIDQSTTGFSDLVSLRIYSFSPGAPVHGEAEGDEVFITVMWGEATIKVSGPNTAEYQLSDKGGARAIYLPPHHQYELTPRGPVDVAYARARAIGAKPPREFSPSGGGDLIVGDTQHGEKLEFALFAVPGGGALPVQTRAAGELPERLAHVRAEGGASAVSGGQPLALADWDALALGPGEEADFDFVSDGLALVVAARR